MIVNVGSRGGANEGVFGVRCAAAGLERTLMSAARATTDSS
jgi:hypothetical protein